MRSVDPTRVIPRPGSDAAAAEEQAALRRVATLVASGAQAPEIFRAVAEEAGRLLGARSSATFRYDDAFAVTVGLVQSLLLAHQLRFLLGKLYSHIQSFEFQYSLQT